MKRVLFAGVLLLLPGCQIALPGIGDQNVTIEGLVQSGAEIAPESCPDALYVFNPFPFEDNLHLQLRWDKETLFDEAKFIGKTVRITGTLPDQSGGICEALTCQCARYLVVQDVTET